MKKKLLTLALVLTMLLTLTACGSDADKLVGTWKCEVDLSENINDVIRSGLDGMDLDEEVIAYLYADSFNYVFYCEFNKDGTYSVSADVDALEASVDAYKAKLTEDFPRYLVASVYAGTGMELSVDEILAASDISSVEEAVEVMLPTVESLVEIADKEGKFEVKDGKLFSTDGLDESIDYESYETYVLDDGTLAILDHVGEGSSAWYSLAESYPVVFEKA